MQLCYNLRLMCCIICKYFGISIVFYILSFLFRRIWWFLRVLSIYRGYGNMAIVHFTWVYVTRVTFINLHFPFFMLYWMRNCFSFWFSRPGFNFLRAAIAHWEIGCFLSYVACTLCSLRYLSPWPTFWFWELS